MAVRGVSVAVGATVLLAITNRVLYKLALVPMKGYPFFLAQATTFGYVAVYFSILFSRYRAWIVTKEMFSLPKIHFVVIGVLEALGVASGTSAGVILNVV
ncbi:Protein CLT2 [Carex littledalei]|uniref:Protein CLT2 n=1 Tax=Carex littledalei TaxID=544730 RepID=A0A833R876_9POAL|nr:Protein CLT2 [Carex littledalei]